MTAGTQSRPNVLLIVVDACRADALEPYAGSVLESSGADGTDELEFDSDAVDHETPAIAALADEGTVFRRAISPAPWTLPSVSSLLTGLDPHEHGATSRRFAIDEGQPLQCDLSAAGYRTIHLSPKTWIGDWLPQGSRFGQVDEFTGPRHRHFDDGRDVRDLSRGVARGPRWYATVLRRALATDAPLRSLGNAAAFKLAEATGDAWLDDVRASERAAEVVDERFAEAAGDDDRPFFAYVHLMDPHLPFYVPNEFRTDTVRPPGCEEYEAELEYMQSLMDDIWAIRTGDRVLTPEERSYLRTRYADEVRYADHAVGRMLESLRNHGLADETLVALTGDHGEHLGERLAEPNGAERAGGEWTLLDHQASVRLPVLRVPLVLRYPGVFEDGERDDLVQPHYLAETIRSLAGLEHDPSRSLLPDDEPRPVARASYEGVVRSHPPADAPTEGLFRSRKTAVAGEWKLDLVGDGPEDPRARRIDWAANEAESVPLEAVPDEASERLEDALGEIDGRDKRGAGGGSADAGGESGEQAVPEAVEDRLSRLGYR